MNKKIIAVGILGMFLLTTSSVFAAVGGDNNYNQITEICSFDRPCINQVTLDGSVYDRIIMPGCPGAGDPGEPNLPVRGVYVLLPQGTEVSKIEVTTGEKIFLGSGFNVEPVREPVKLSDISSFSNPVQNKLVYRSDGPLPETLFTEVGTYDFRGYKILVLLLHPVQYIPNSGELYYFRDMTVNVGTVENGHINPLFRNTEHDEIEITKKVDNALAVDSYTEKIVDPIPQGNCSLLILTTDSLKDNFEPLKDAHDANGITTEIKTLRDISLFPDSVTPEDIRDFIRDEYINNGIEYVLIGGDDDVVPARHLWVKAWGGGEATTMPSDLYYACLDDTYNYDGDDQWGEPDDGPGGGDVDLIAEVYVGRACVGNSNEVDNFIGKTLAYMDSGGYSNGPAVMAGEKLDDVPTWGGDYMDELIDGSSAHMYTTVGINSSTYDIDTLYDKDWYPEYWPTSEIVSRINNGARIINHLGHSTYDYSMRMDNARVDSLTNEDPCFLYSQGCMAGGFDYSDCIAEHWTVKTDHAAFAVIMNARYGWYVQGSTDGASQRFHREFWDAIFGEDIPEIGKANQDSKEDNIYRINGACMRWCYYQTNLFGDPTLTFYTSSNTPPDKPTKPSGQRIGVTGENYRFKTTTTDEDGDKIYYKWGWGDGTFSEWLGPFDSGEEVSVLHNWSQRGIYLVKVKARDEHRAESEWSDPLIIIMLVNQLNQQGSQMHQRGSR
jgi:hypothetical protein